MRLGRGGDLGGVRRNERAVNLIKKIACMFEIFSDAIKYYIF